ncbi:MAG TPA: STAS domain-containing protein [Phycisphaerae bacterium]|nr:STAS domain-containing protein [Phycisphaerae bacterium]
MTPMEHKPFVLTVQRRDRAAVLKVSGSVSLTEAEPLREQIDQLVAEQVPVIVLDVSEMDFICSLGLGAIIAGHLKCRHHCGQIKIVRPSGPVRELLETTRLTKLFGLYDSVEDALPRS